MSIVLGIFSQYALSFKSLQEPGFTASVSLEIKDVISYKLKSEVFPVHTVRAYVGSRGIGSFILNFGFRRRWLNGQPNVPSTLPPGEEPPVPVE